jgi:hypothetical protein
MNKLKIHELAVESPSYTVRLSNGVGLSCWAGELVSGFRQG